MSELEELLDEWRILRESSGFQGDAKEHVLTLAPQVIRMEAALKCADRYFTQLHGFTKDPYKSDDAVRELVAEFIVDAKSDVLSALRGET